MGNRGLPEYTTLARNLHNSPTMSVTETASGAHTPPTLFPAKTEVPAVERTRVLGGALQRLFVRVSDGSPTGSMETRALCTPRTRFRIAISPLLLLPIA